MYNKLGIYILASVVGGSLLAGCAGEGNRGTCVTYDTKATKPKILQKPSPLLPLVVIRYPASAQLDPTNRTTLLAAYKKVWERSTDEQIERALSEELAKTQYHVMEFYRVLASRLPAGSVLLSPAQIGTDLKLHDIIAPPPHVLQLDAMVAVNFSRILYDNQYGPDTAGNKISPVVSVLIRDLESADTVEFKKQFAATMTTNAGLARLPSTDAVQATWQREYAAKPEPFKKKLVPAVKKANGVILENGVYFGFSGSPPQGWRVPAADLRRQIKPACGEDQKCMPCEGLWNAYADAVVEILNTIDWQRASSRRVYAFDHALGSDRVSKEDRAEIWKELVPAEVDVITKQDRDVSELIYRDEFGCSVREQMLAEMNVMDQIDQSQNNEAFASVMAIASAGAAVGVQYSAASSGTLTPQLNQQVTNTIVQSQVMMNSVTANETAFRKQVRAQLEAFTQRVVSGQIVIVLNTSRGEFTIRGGNLGDCRKKIREVILSDFINAGTGH